MPKETLAEYKKKRKFGKTPEPSGKVASPKGELRFVVQKHHATSLHYDFRLEFDGVLKSWAVPKGPSMIPVNKRLAMHVEDHPLDYISFEGVIPEGNYGAGPVIVWDTGTYVAKNASNVQESEKVMKHDYQAGKLEFMLHGEKLHGMFALVKLNDPRQENAWLLMKMKDEYALKEESPQDFSVLSGCTLEQVRSGTCTLAEGKKGIVKQFELKSAIESEFTVGTRPMLAKLTDKVFDDGDWLYEIKYDGYRTISEIQKSKVRLISRKGIDVTKKYSPLVKELLKFKKDMILDGEVIVLDDQGENKFELLQNYPEGGGTLAYFVFDLLYFDGYDLKLVPLEKRKEMLQKILPKSDIIRFSQHVSKEGTKLSKLAVQKNWEGVIAKRKDSIYQTGQRSSDWLKIKVQNEQEFIICGYTEPKGERSYFGSLALGAYKDGKLVYVGNVGTGLDEVNLKNLHASLEKLQTKTHPFDAEPETLHKTIWVKPMCVCQVRFKEFTSSYQLRHAVFLGLRDDKKPEQVKIETPKPKSTLLKKPEKELKFTNLDKVFWPEEGYTKGDLVKYYEEIADVILPYLIDRPQSLYRTPNGIKGEGFFQKNVRGEVPKWIKTIEIYSESKDEEIEFMLCQDKETLLFMANFGSIEINPWSSRIQALDYPDYAVFDLDPLEISFQAVIEVALSIHDILEKINVPHYCKTSGSTGIHIYVPLGAKYTYDQAKQFSKVVQLLVRKKLPKITSHERSPSARKHKVYLDYLQNGKGITMATVYSARPKPHATVSTPVTWEELQKQGFDPTRFTIKTVPKRVKKIGDLWGNLLKQDIDMLEALKELHKLIL